MERLFNQEELFYKLVLKMWIQLLILYKTAFLKLLNIILIKQSFLKIINNSLILVLLK